MNQTDSLEQLWNNLLSRDELLIKKAFTSIASPEQMNCIQHLRKMSSGKGWIPEQVESARIALKYLENYVQLLGKD